MLIRIGNFEYTECWDGVLYKKLSAYPDITAWEIQTVLDFTAYEEAHGRKCEIDAPDAVRRAIEAYQPVYAAGTRLAPPEKIQECTACPTFRGCMTDLVCHTSPAENAKAIFACGSLLSPVKWRGIPAETLAKERRNAANDPADYFDYIMFSWGNCQAGDRLVTERKLGRFPREAELGPGFTPGVRFYFDYGRLCRHPGAVFEGVLPLKIKDEVVLKDWGRAVVIPEPYRAEFAALVPDVLKDRTYYLDIEGLDIWAWAEKAYTFVKELKT